MTASSLSELHKTVRNALMHTPVVDMHTHLFAPAFGDLLLRGIDELLTYHYLIAEVMRVAPITADEYYAMPKRAQADLIWRELFIERSPVSESCRGVLTVLTRLGLDTASRDLDEFRSFFDALDARDHVDLAFRTANLKAAVMTNDPFDDVERKVWLRGFDSDDRFLPALRIDPLLNDWPRTCEKLSGWGYKVETSLNQTTLAAIRKFLGEWLDRTKALYMAVSLPPSFAFPEESPRAEIIEDCVLPVALEYGIPFAMMIGVKRNVNPALRLASDGVGLADVDSVVRLCGSFPKNKFLVTMLARENQHELAVATRKFSNLLLFGCWWFLNNPSLIDEITRMRFELLGLGFVPQHSDARVLDQVVYKWDHSRRIIADVLADKYADLLAADWAVNEHEIQRDAERLLETNFQDFLAR
jgi:hypothetical protein